MEKLLTTKQASEYLGLSPVTLSNARYTGTGVIIPYIKIGSSVRYRLSELESYIKINTYSHTSERKGTHV
jgi:hypothetical protein